MLRPLSKRVAVIPGDGIGPEVVAEGLKVIEATCDGLEFEHFPWGCSYFERTGRMMPDDGLETLRPFDAIYLGAVGWHSVPDHVSLWGLLLPIRKGFQQYVNLRPVRLLPGVKTPLSGRAPSDIDMLFVRENTEGEYSGAGGRIHMGTSSELAVEVPIFTRMAAERTMRYAFERARQRRQHLISVTKSNASKYAYVLWDDVAAELSTQYPDIRLERVHVDAMAARMVLHPESIDVVVGSNLFADILTDLGAALQGGLGLAASANLDPTGHYPSMFEPVHGSAPDIAGQGVANPIGAVGSAALLLQQLGYADAAQRVDAAVARILRNGRTLTPDLGGTSRTAEVGDSIVEALELDGFGPIPTVSSADIG